MIEDLGNIRSPENYLNSLWSWEPFNPAFAGTKIRIGDVDGIVERNGYFLMLEGKYQGGEVGRGQQLMLNALVATGRFTVVVLWGRPPTEIQAYQVLGQTEVLPGGTGDVLRLIKDWYESVSKLTVPAPAPPAWYYRQAVAA